jgi:hypothetical protein
MQQQYTYLGGGVRHERFLSTLEQVSPAARARVESATEAFC